jgi:hypothetical protein
LTLLAGAVSSGLKVVHYGNTDTVYIQEVPFHSLMQLEISVSGEWTLRIEARQDLVSSYITPYQDILNHRYGIPIGSFQNMCVILKLATHVCRGTGATQIPLTYKWEQPGDIHINLTLHEHASEVGWHTHKHYPVKFLDAASYITADPSLGEELQVL